MPLESPPFRQVLLGPVIPALQIGTATGVAGVVFGGVAGLFRSANPILFTAAAGTQWFILGSCFFYARGAVLMGNLPFPRRRQELVASGVGGCLAGAVGGALRSRANILPGAIVVGIMGLVGQAGVHGVQRNNSNTFEREPLIQRLMRWLPFKPLSDDEYEGILREKLLRIEAEISILDDEIDELRTADPGSVKD